MIEVTCELVVSELSRAAVVVFQKCRVCVRTFVRLTLRFGLGIGLGREVRTDGGHFLDGRGRLGRIPADCSGESLSSSLVRLTVGHVSQQITCQK